MTPSGNNLVLAEQGNISSDGFFSSLKEDFTTAIEGINNVYEKSRFNLLSAFDYGKQSVIAGAGQIYDVWSQKTTQEKAITAGIVASSVALFALQATGEGLSLLTVGGVGAIGMASYYLYSTAGKNIPEDPKDVNRFYRSVASSKIDSANKKAINAFMESHFKEVSPRDRQAEFEKLLDSNPEIRSQLEEQTKLEKEKESRDLKSKGFSADGVFGSMFDIGLEWASKFRFSLLNTAVNKVFTVSKIVHDSIKNKEFPPLKELPSRFFETELDEIKGAITVQKNHNAQNLSVQLKAIEDAFGKEHSNFFVNKSINSKNEAVGPQPENEQSFGKLLASKTVNKIKDVFTGEYGKEQVEYMLKPVLGSKTLKEGNLEAGIEKVAGKLQEKLKGDKSDPLGLDSTLQNPATPKI